MASPMICTRCYSQGKPRKDIRGTFLLEGLLWLGTVIIFLALSWAIGFLFGFIALTYSLWRITGSRKSCPSCGAPELVPADSPRGMEILKSQPRRQVVLTPEPSVIQWMAAPLARWEKIVIIASVAAFAAVIFYGALVR